VLGAALGLGDEAVEQQRAMHDDRHGAAREALKVTCLTVGITRVAARSRCHGGGCAW
jgi:hypothetical protein